MLTSGDDITIVLSGGASNLNPNNSLGGDPSSNPITDNVINNLFSDVSTTESANGLEDYRCIYIFNDGETAVYNFSTWIQDFSEGSVMEIGIENRNEAQRITLSGGSITGGSFTISFKGHDIISEYNSDLSVWASSLETSISELSDGQRFFNDVSVIAQNIGSTIIFDIAFGGLDAKRNFDKFELQENALIPLSTIDIFVTTPQEGSPINTIASEINVATTPPGGVSFVAATEIEPIVLPVINPNEGFPLWIKRTVEAGVGAVEGDGLKLKFRAESLPPA